MNCPRTFDSLISADIDVQVLGILLSGFSDYSCTNVASTLQSCGTAYNMFCIIEVAPHIVPSFLPLQYLASGKMLMKKSSGLSRVGKNPKMRHSKVIRRNKGQISLCCHTSGDPPAAAYLHKLLFCD